MTQYLERRVGQAIPNRKIGSNNDQLKDLLRVLSDIYHPASTFALDLWRTTNGIKLADRSPLQMC